LGSERPEQYEKREYEVKFHAGKFCCKSMDNAGTQWQVARQNEPVPVMCASLFSYKKHIKTE
jgi:hypothetical protein